MKIGFVVLSAIVLACVVEDSNCGVIGDMYGTVRNKTVAIKDGVTDWLSYGKDWVLGSTKEDPNIPQGRNGDEIVEDDGLLRGIYDSLLGGFQSVREKVFGIFVSEEKKNNNGFIRNMYDKVKHRITLMMSALVSNDELKKPDANDDLSEIRRALNMMINRQKHIHEEQWRNGVDTLKDKVHNIDDKLHDSVDTVKDGANDMKVWAGDHIYNRFNSASDSINKGVNDAKISLGSTLDDWRQSGVEISEKEREVLNAISNRIRSRISNARLVENSQQLSYAEERKKD